MLKRILEDPSSVAVWHDVGGVWNDRKRWGVKFGVKFFKCCDDGSSRGYIVLERWAGHKSLNTNYIYSTLWPSTRWHQQQQHRWQTASRCRLQSWEETCLPNHYQEVQHAMHWLRTPGGVTRKAVRFIIKMHMRFLGFLQHVAWTCLPRISWWILNCHITRKSICIAQNLAIGAHIPILKTFCSGGRCHKLDVFLMGLSAFMGS